MKPRTPLTAMQRIRLLYPFTVCTDTGKVGAGFTYPAHATHVAQEVRFFPNFSGVCEYANTVRWVCKPIAYLVTNDEKP